MKTHYTTHNILFLFRLTLVSLLLPLFFSCGGNEQSSTETPAESSEEKTITLADSMTNKGIGPVKELKLEALDATLAAKGKTIFESKCATCHKFEVKYVGPALAGVTKRRTPEWIMNQILNPEKMIKEDPLAKAMFERYLVPMTFQNLTQDDARSILEYFREEDSK
jgi:cytochrome c